MIGENNHINCLSLTDERVIRSCRSPRWVGGRIATHIKVTTGAENYGEANPRPLNANIIQKSCLFFAR
jgi:hypothetical protein